LKRPLWLELRVFRGEKNDWQSLAFPKYEDPPDPLLKPTPASSHYSLGKQGLHTPMLQVKTQEWVK
jgi:hypothetical protein